MTEAGVSQADLAIGVNMQPSKVSRILQGRSKPSAQEVEWMASYLGVPPPKHPVPQLHQAIPSVAQSQQHSDEGLLQFALGVLSSCHGAIPDPHDPRSVAHAAAETDDERLARKERIARIMNLIEKRLGLPMSGPRA